MPSCRQCQQPNVDDANYCAQCGAALSPATANGPAANPPAEATPEAPAYTQASDQDLWRQFIGPHADHYLGQFKKFSSNGKPKFALSWNWPAFLYISFLWFLYRKMYLHAFVYAIGPMVSSYLTGDISGSLVWSIMAGATANYLYYWHCREGIAEIKKTGKLNPAAQEAALKESGGVQPYVIYVGIALYVLALAGLMKMIQDGPPEGDKVLPRPAKPASMLST